MIRFEDITEFEGVLDSRNFWKKLDEATRDKFLQSVTFVDCLLAGMHFALLADRLTYSEFSEFLDTVGLSPSSFETKKVGCGKNYRRSKSGGCESANGWFCSCIEP